MVSIPTSLAVLSSVICVLAYARWRDNEIAMRHSRALSASFSIPLISAAMMFVAALFSAHLVRR